MTRRLLRTLAVSAAALPSAAFALGLGPIQVNSAFDQPLDAKIPIIAARPGEVDALTASVPSQELFERMGMERTALLNQLIFTVEDRDGRQPFIRVRSRGAVREPLLDILVEVSWASGRMLRDYSVFLDPPTVARRAAPSRQTSSARPAQRNVTASVPAAPRFTGDRYTVGRGETLYGIAERTRPDSSVNVNQMMMALFEANPDAFFEPNINSLNAGAELRVPAREDVATLSKADALAAVRQQSSAPDQTMATGDVEASETATTVADAADVEETGTEAEASTEPGEALAPDVTGPQVRLVQSGADGAEVPGEAGVGSGEGSAEQGEGTAAGGTVAREALIRLEDDGLGLRLVGMDDLSNRMPALIALQDSAMAAGAVRDVVESADLEPVPSVGESEFEETSVDGSQAEGTTTDESQVEEMTADAGATMETEAESPDETVMDAETDPATAGATDTVEAEAGTDAEAGADAAEDAADDAVMAEVTEETVVADAAVVPGQAATDSIDGTTVAETAQPSESIEPKQGLELWLGKGKALFDEAKGQVQSLGFLNEPRTLAMVGGGVLLLLLLILLLIRRAVSSDARQAPASAASALAKPAAAVGTAATSAAHSMDPLDQATRLMEDGEPARAVSLLRGLMARGENNAQVALKLLGAQMATADGDGFAHDAATHRTLLEEAGLWDEVETMAQSVCPDHALFGGLVEAQIEEAPSLPADMEPVSDADFGSEVEHGSELDHEAEPDKHAEAPRAEDGADTTGIEQAEPVVSTSESKGADVLEFSLAGRAEPRAEPETETDTSESEVQAKAVNGEPLSFDIDDFRTTSDADLTETALTEAQADDTSEDVGVALEEEYAKLEAEGLTDILEPELGETELLSGSEDAGGDELSFDPIPDHGLDAGIEEEDDSFVDTKLDLATAYLEMGDDSGARSLYQEVLEEGNDDQKKQAMEGLSKLG